MRILVVRHYRTVSNAERRIMGWGDAPPARDWEDDLRWVDRRLHRAGVGFDAYYSSDLGRARETALYYARGRKCEKISARVEFNEVNYGALLHRPKQWVAERYLEYKVDPDFVFPQGESFSQMQRRSFQYLLSLQDHHQNDTLLLVAHAGVVRALVSRLLGLNFADHLKRQVSHRYIGDFVIENDVCVAYDELGKVSGFIEDGVVQVPYPKKKLKQRGLASTLDPSLIDCDSIDLFESSALTPH